MEKEFCLEDYLKKEIRCGSEFVSREEDTFNNVCITVKNELEREWDNCDDVLKNKKLQREKLAIMGHVEEMGYYKERIREILREKEMEKWKYP